MQCYLPFLEYFCLHVVTKKNRDGNPCKQIVNPHASIHFERFFTKNLFLRNWLLLN